MAKAIRLLDKKAFFCLYKKNFMQVRAFERYISLKKKKKKEKKYKKNYKKTPSKLDPLTKVSRSESTLR